METLLPLHQLWMIRAESISSFLDLKSISFTLRHKHCAIYFVLVLAESAFLDVFCRSWVHEFVLAHSESLPTRQETCISFNALRLVVRNSIDRSSYFVLTRSNFHLWESIVLDFFDFRPFFAYGISHLGAEFKARFDFIPIDPPNVTIDTMLYFFRERGVWSFLCPFFVLQQFSRNFVFLRTREF